MPSRPSACSFTPLANGTRAIDFPPTKVVEQHTEEPSVPKLPPIWSSRRPAALNHSRASSASSPLHEHQANDASRNSACRPRSRSHRHLIYMRSLAVCCILTVSLYSALLLAQHAKPGSSIKQTSSIHSPDPRNYSAGRAPAVPKWPHRSII